MNSTNDNIHTASGVAQNKNVRVQALGRGAHSKSKLHSPPQADRNWKPINAFAVCLGRQMGAAHNIYTRVGFKHRDLGDGGGFTRPISENGGGDQLWGVPVIGRIPKDWTRGPEWRGYSRIWPDAHGRVQGSLAQDEKGFVIWNHSCYMIESRLDQPCGDTCQGKCAHCSVNEREHSERSQGE